MESLVDNKRNFERRYTNVVRDSLGIKRDFFKRKKEVAICDNMLIYSKDQQGVDMEDKDFKKYISRAISNSKSGDKAFYEEGKKSTRVVFLKKCECVKEPCADGWKLKITHKNSKIVEIFFGKEKSKCQRWYDIVQKIQRGHSKSVDTVLERSSSFEKLKGLDDEDPVASNVSLLSKTMPRRTMAKEEYKEKIEVEEIITQEGKEKSEGQSMKEISEEVREKSKKQFRFEYTEQSKTRLKDSCTQYLADTIDFNCGTDKVEYRDSAV